MLARLLGFSLAHRGLVLALTLAVAALGAMAIAHLPLDAFPDTTPVQVQVNVTAPALSPLEVERRLTLPIEQSLGGLHALHHMRSLSRPGFAQVVLVFGDGVDIWHARQMVNERLAAVELPAGVARPTLGPVSTGLGEIFHYLVRGEGKSLAELRAAQDWILAPRLRAVPGVAEVNSWGGEERQVHVVVDPLALAARGLALDDVRRALAASGGSAEGGVVERGGEARLVRAVAQLGKPDEVGAVVVSARDGVPVRIGDVAQVIEGAEIRHGAVTADGRGEVVLGLGFLYSGENSREVSRRLAAALAEAGKSLPPGIEVEIVHQRTDLVDRVLGTVRKNLLEAAALVVAVLLLFLGDLRAGLVVASVIPLSLLLAANAMAALGLAGTLMSLGAIDFGLVVDSAVIQVENAVRRLGEDRTGRSVREVVLDAVLEVRRPTLFGELLILVVYLPVLALSGVEGKLFRPMAIALLLVLGASMLLSLTAVPALLSLMLAGRRRRHAEPRIARLLKRMYAPVLAAALARRGLVLALAGLALAVAAVVGSRLGAEFVPRLEEQSVVINAIRLASVSLDESVRHGSLIERELERRFPDEIERVWTRTGSAEVATDPMGIELSDVFISLKPRESWRRGETQAELVAAMRGALSDLPGMRLVFTQPIEMRVNEMLAGTRADVVVKLFGDDLTALHQQALAVQEVLRTVPGSADSSIQQLIGQPVLEVVPDRDALARHGARAADVLDLVEALGPVPVTEMLEGERRIPVAIRLAPIYRQDPERLRALPVPSADGTVPLGALATIRTVAGPAVIEREQGRRRLAVQTNVVGRDLAGFVAEARRRIDAEVALPPGTWLGWGGQLEQLDTAARRLALVVPLALGLVLLLLYWSYGRWLDALRVFLGVPFAAVGGVLALALRGMPLSVPAAIGFVALSGVSVLADLVLVSTVRDRLAEGLAVRAAVAEAAIQRVRPVVMTALVACLGFLPMALSHGVGAEVQRPLATVLIGGLVSSTALSLVVLPVLYTFLGPRQEKP